MDSDLDARIARIRRFSRMYMQRIGALAENIFGSPYSLAEVRVLNELCFCGDTTATVLARDLDMDSGYLSRILHKFEAEGLILREKSISDGRSWSITLSEKGKTVGNSVLEEARGNVLRILEKVPEPDQIRLVEAMDVIDGIINADGEG